MRLKAAEHGEEGILVAVLASRIVGAESIRWSQLYGLQVAAEVRGQGIGRTLVRAAEELGRRHGADHTSLDVDVDDARAIAFYKALGYTVVRHHQHHWRSLDPRTGAVINEGTAPTLILRHLLR